MQLETPNLRFARSAVVHLLLSADRQTDQTQRQHLLAQAASVQALIDNAKPEATQ